MHDHVLRGQIDLLIKEGFIKQGDKKKAFKALKDKFWNSRIAVIWNTDDVKEHASNFEVSLNDDDAEQILYDIFQRHDAEYGITWDSLSSAIDDFIHDELIDIKNTTEKNLPLLIGKLKSKKNERALERRMRGIKDWELDYEG